MKLTDLCPRIPAALLAASLFSCCLPATGHAQSIYAGIYEGSFSGPEGDGAFMAMSRASGTATLLLFVYGGTHERKLSFPINAKTGAFSFKTDEFGTLVTGTIDPTLGTYTNEFGTGQGSGNLLPFSGELSSSAGYYKGTYKGAPGSGAIWAILSASGRILMAFDDPDSGGGAVGQVQPDGTISWDQFSSETLEINATLNLATNTFAGTANNGDGPVTFSVKRTEAASAQPIIIQTQPQHQIAGTGDMVMLECMTEVDESVSVQWQKNGKSIPGANELALTLEQLTLFDAGSYRVILKNAWGTVTSAVAELTVVETYGRNVDVFSESPQTSKIVMTARAAGKITGYSWARGGGGSLARAGFKVAGANTATLTITPNAPLQMEDEGFYTCTITGPGGTFTSGSQNVRILGTSSPMFAMDILPEARLNFFYETPLYSEFDFMSRAKTWKLKTGSTLPSGLKLTNDGKLTGIPKKVSTGFQGFTFTVQATNRTGTSERTFSLVVQPQGDSVAGTYMAVIPRSPYFNNELGGRLDLNVTATGGLSGKLTLGATSYPIAGAFNAKFGGLAANLVLKASGAVKHPNILLSLARAPEVDTVAGQILEVTSDPMQMGENLPIILNRSPYSKSNPVLNLAGKYHLELVSPGIENAPQGSGYAILTLTNLGGITWGGKLADGTTITGNASLGNMGGLPQAPIHQLLYGGTGSLQGQVNLDTLSQTASGDMTWFKQAQTTVTTNYPAGFPVLDLIVGGGIYKKTTPLLTQLGMASEALNAQLSVIHAGLEGDDLQTFTLAANGTATFIKANNPYNFTLKIDPATGLVTGSFTVPGATAALGRKATISGILVPDDDIISHAACHFLLVQPAVPGAGSPPVLSGLLELFPSPL